MQTPAVGSGDGASRFLTPLYPCSLPAQLRGHGNAHFLVTDKKEFPLLISTSDLLLLTVYSAGISGTLCHVADTMLGASVWIGTEGDEDAAVTPTLVC